MSAPTVDGARIRGRAAACAVQCAAQMMNHLHRIALSLLVLSACVDPDDDTGELGESVAALSIGPQNHSGMWKPGIPTTFRGADFRVQVLGDDIYGRVSWDIQLQSGVWAGSTYATLVGSTPLTSSLYTAIQQPDNKTVVLAVGTNGGLYRTEQVAAYSRTWTAWTLVGPALARQPSVARNSDGRLEAVYVGTDGRIKQIWQNAANGTWSAPYDTGVLSSATPEIARDPQNRLEIFVPTATGFCGMLTWRQLAPNGFSGWSSPQLTPGPCTNTIAVIHLGTTTEVLAQTTAGHLWRFFRATSDDLFSTTTSFTPAPSTPAAAPSFVRKDDGRILAFTGVTTCTPAPLVRCGTYYVKVRDTNGSWSGWMPFVTAQEALSVAGAESWINTTEIYLRLSNGSQDFQRVAIH